jgi:hypothetical protein
VASLRDLDPSLDEQSLVELLQEALAAGRARVPMDVPGYERVAERVAPRLTSDEPHPGAVAAAALLGDVGWLSFSLPLRERVALLVHAAEACSVPFPLFGRDDRALFKGERRLPWRLAMAVRMRDAVYDLNGTVLEWREGDTASAIYGEGCLVEWHELVPAEVAWSATWWLGAPTPPHPHWARVFNTSEAVTLRISSDETLVFANDREAKTWLRDEGYAPYEELLAKDGIPQAQEPPLDWLG